MSYCYPERTTYNDSCHLKKCCVSPLRKEVTAVFKRLGKMNMVVESCGLLVQSHDCNPHDPCNGGGGGKCLSVCLSVCPSVYSRISHRFFFQGP